MFSFSAPLFWGGFLEETEGFVFGTSLQVGSLLFAFKPKRFGSVVAARTMQLTRLYMMAWLRVSTNAGRLIGFLLLFLQRSQGQRSHIVFPHGVTPARSSASSWPQVQPLLRAGHPVPWKTESQSDALFCAHF